MHSTGSILQGVENFHPAGHAQTGKLGVLGIIRFSIRTSIFCSDKRDILVPLDIVSKQILINISDFQNV